MPAQASPKHPSASGLDVHLTRKEAWILGVGNKSSWNNGERRALSRRSAGSSPILWRETRSRVEQYHAALKQVSSHGRGERIQL